LEIPLSTTKKCCCCVEKLKCYENVHGYCSELVKAKCSSADPFAGSTLCDWVHVQYCDPKICEEYEISNPNDSKNLKWTRAKCDKCAPPGQCGSECQKPDKKTFYYDENWSNETESRDYAIKNYVYKCCKDWAENQNRQFKTGDENIPDEDSCQMCNCLNTITKTRTCNDATCKWNPWSSSVKHIEIFDCKEDPYKKHRVCQQGNPPSWGSPSEVCGAKIACKKDKDCIPDGYSSNRYTKKINVHACCVKDLINCEEGGTGNCTPAQCWGIKYYHVKCQNPGTVNSKCQWEDENGNWKDYEVSYSESKSCASASGGPCNPYKCTTSPGYYYDPFSGIIHHNMGSCSKECSKNCGAECESKDDCKGCCVDKDGKSYLDGELKCNSTDCKVQKLDCGVNDPIFGQCKFQWKDFQKCSPYKCSGGSCTKECSIDCGAQCEGGSYSTKGEGCGPNCHNMKLNLSAGSSRINDIGTKLALKNGHGIYAYDSRGNLYGVYRLRNCYHSESRYYWGGRNCGSPRGTGIVFETDQNQPCAVNNRYYLPYFNHPGDCWQGSLSGSPPPNWDFPAKRFPEKRSCISVVRNGKKYCYCPPFMAEDYRWVGYNDEVWGSRFTCNSEQTGTTDHSATYNPLCSNMNYPKDRWQRVWYDSGGNCLGDGPDLRTSYSTQFDNEWGGKSSGTYCRDTFKFESSRTICFDQEGVYEFFLGADGGTGSLTISGPDISTATVSATSTPSGIHGINWECGSTEDTWVFSWEWRDDSWLKWEYEWACQMCLDQGEPIPDPPDEIQPNLVIGLKKACYQFKIDFEKTDPDSAELMFYYSWVGAPSHCANDGCTLIVEAEKEENWCDENTCECKCKKTPVSPVSCEPCQCVETGGGYWYEPSYAYCSGCSKNCGAECESDEDCERLYPSTDWTYDPSLDDKKCEEDGHTLRITRYEKRTVYKCNIECTPDYLFSNPASNDSCKCYAEIEIRKKPWEPSQPNPEYRSCCPHTCENDNCTNKCTFDCPGVECEEDSDCDWKDGWYLVEEKKICDSSGCNVVIHQKWEKRDYTCDTNSCKCDNYTVTNTDEGDTGIIERCGNCKCVDGACSDQCAISCGAECESDSDCPHGSTYCSGNWLIHDPQYKCDTSDCNCSCYQAENPWYQYCGTDYNEVDNYCQDSQTLCTIITPHSAGCASGACYDIPGTPSPPSCVTCGGDDHRCDLRGNEWWCQKKTLSACVGSSPNAYCDGGSDWEDEAPLGPAQEFQCVSCSSDPTHICVLEKDYTCSEVPPGAMIHSGCNYTLDSSVETDCGPPTEDVYQCAPCNANSNHICVQKKTITNTCTCSGSPQVCTCDSSETEWEDETDCGPSTEYRCGPCEDDPTYSGPSGLICPQKRTNSCSCTSGTCSCDPPSDWQNLDVPCSEKYQCCDPDDSGPEEAHCGSQNFSCVETTDSGTGDVIDAKCEPQTCNDCGLFKCDASTGKCSTDCDNKCGAECEVDSGKPGCDCTCPIDPSYPGGHCVMDSEAKDSFSPYFGKDPCKCVFSPWAEGLNEDEIYCYKKGKGLVGFEWTYRGCYPESQFELQIDDDPDFSSPEVDRTVSVNPADYPNGTKNSQLVEVVPSPAPSDSLTYDTTYYWRVRVWDSEGNRSDCGYPDGWCYPPSGFSSPPGTSFYKDPHPYPFVEFECQNISKSGPLSKCEKIKPKAIVGDTIKFVDESKCYLTGAASSEYDCKTGSSTTYSWDFGDGNTSNHKGDVSHIYQKQGIYNVKLTVCDDVGCCTKLHTIYVGLKLPKWKEISPF